MIRMSGTQKPGRSATSAKVLAGSKNTPVSREPSPKPLGWGSGSGRSSGVMIGSIVLQSTPARSLFSESELHTWLNRPRGNSGPVILAHQCTRTRLVVTAYLDRKEIGPVSNRNRILSPLSALNADRKSVVERKTLEV